jgi:hypothetical protein
VPIAPSGHAGTFHKDNQIGCWICILERPVFAMEVIKGDIDDALHLFSRHRSLQYLTSVQFLAHFLRHSNSRPQRWQVLGANPFLTLATRDISQF